MLVCVFMSVHARVRAMHLCLGTLLSPGLSCRAASASCTNSPFFKRDVKLLSDLGAITRRHAARYPESALLLGDRAGGSAQLTDGSGGLGVGDVVSYEDSQYSTGSQWEPAMTEDGTPYWYNAVTGESSWEPPESHGAGNAVDQSLWDLEV